VTSLTDAPPGDAVQHQHENGRRNGYDQQFWIQQDDRPHLFTVFALCDPPLDGTANDYSPYWLRQDAVGVGWFFSKREQ
jgi:hypothetical protein